MTRIDFHTHVIVPTPDFAAEYEDPRWPTVTMADGRAELTRDGRVVRSLTAAAWSMERRLADMDASGVDIQVLSPIPPLICDWPDAELADRWTRQLNCGIAALVAAAPARFVGLGTVPLQHPDLAVDVLRDAAALGLAGVEIGTHAGGRELDHPALRPFFAEAERLAMIVFIHPLILGAQAEWTERISGAEVTFGLGMPTDTAIAAARLVFGGVTAEFPGLRICLSHGGGTFFWTLPRIAHLWDAGGTAAHELTANVFADSVLYRPENLTHLCRTIGANHVVFGTDYPLPAQDSLTGGVMAELGPLDVDQVSSGTATRLLGARLPRVDTALSVGTPTGSE